MSDSLDLFAALADASRLRIVALLRRMELSIGEVAQVLGQSQPRVSRHVRILTEAGIVARRREGSSVFLTLALARFAVPLFALLDAAEGTGEHAQHAADRARLTTIRAERAAAAGRWFADHAGQWEALRALHVEDAAVERALGEVIGDAPGRLVDVGTGTGRMLELFAQRADSAIGIDRSPEMLKLARVKLDGTSADLCQGDIAALPLADAAADTLILHHVLHFIPTPEPALAECARTLGPGGRLVIVDFAAHDREELRRDHAHARLGFDDAQIGAWLAKAGLALRETRTLEGGPLVTKIWVGQRRGAGKRSRAA